MKPPGHIIASAIISIGVWTYFKSPGAALISFISGVGIDIDHALDYYTLYKFSFNFHEVYKAHVERRVRKIYILLHSYELIIFLWLLIIVFSLNSLWIAMAIGLTQHILIDQFTNPVNKFIYFFLYRASKNFKKELLTH